MAHDYSSKLDVKHGELPSPDEANLFAAVTGRLVAASDGRFYSGEEALASELGAGGADDVIDAIHAIADCVIDPSTWLSEVELHRLENLRPGSVDLAIEWLTEFRQKLWQMRLGSAEPDRLP